MDDMGKNNQNKDNDVASANRLLDLIRDTPSSMPPGKDKKEKPADQAGTPDELSRDIDGLDQISSGLVESTGDLPEQEAVPSASKDGKVTKTSKVDVRRLARIKNSIKKDESGFMETDSSDLVEKSGQYQSPEPLQKTPELPQRRVAVGKTSSFYLSISEKRGTLSALFSKSMLGLDIGSHTIKSVQLEKTQAGFKLVSLSVVEIDSASPEAKDYKLKKIVSIQKALKDIKLNQVKIVGGVGGAGITVRQIKLPSMSEEELASSIKWELQRYIPYSVKEVEVDFQVLRSDENTMDVLAVIVPNDLLNAYKSLMHSLQIKPAITDVEPLALMNSVLDTTDLEEDEVVILFDIGANTSTLNIYTEMGEYFVHYVPVSGNSFTREIQQNYQLEYLEAEAHKKMGQGVVEVIKPALDIMIHDVRKTLTFYKNQTSVKGFSQIILTGGNVYIPGLDRYLADELDLRVKVFDPFENITFDKNVFPPETLNKVSYQLSLAIGLAKRGFPSTETS